MAPSPSTGASTPAEGIEIQAGGAGRARGLAATGVDASRALPSRSTIGSNGGSPPGRAASRASCAATAVSGPMRRRRSRRTRARAALPRPRRPAPGPRPCAAIGGCCTPPAALSKRITSLPRRWRTNPAASTSASTASGRQGAPSSSPASPPKPVAGAPAGAAVPSVIVTMRVDSPAAAHDHGGRRGTGRQRDARLGRERAALPARAGDGYVVGARRHVDVVGGVCVGDLLGDHAVADAHVGIAQLRRRLDGAEQGGALARRLVRVDAQLGAVAVLLHERDDRVRLTVLERLVGGGDGVAAGARRERQPGVAGVDLEAARRPCRTPPEWSPHPPRRLRSSAWPTPRPERHGRT